ncbi:hypothetical protein FF100_18855 [Methylobacterium terricola]|uniref:Uncharacterized protein n=1 Tax=Methylobacterium terricola TaxID=2583531 RepID=A0A5C4LGR5_9HYPH|nr:hypothetical protein [Methylobacterium terricola]TNC11697.1 hypothetical protein FF100_18855 [Methylobacterium terricola]
MHYDYEAAANRRRAAELLATLKGRVPYAEGALDATLARTASTSSAHWRLSNVVGVHLHETPDGWCADLVFEGLPDGVPSMIPTPKPFHLRVDAVREAIGQLRLCDGREKLPLPPGGAEELWFKFDLLDVRVDPNHLPTLAASALPHEEKVEIAKGKLASLRLVICDDEPMTAARLATAPAKLQDFTRLMCAYACTQGLRQFTLADGVMADYELAAIAPMR